MDKFSDYPTSLTAPARDAAPVVPHDTNELPVLPRAIYVGQPGVVAARLAGGQTVLFENVPAGTVLPVRCNGINATGTTASGIVALW
ncbi:MAG: hypothetical protein KDE08_13000 [Rhodobacteraceae bacterium]|nr:hypothetical protein [Paracoccaceae bacterium]